MFIKRSIRILAEYEYLSFGGNKRRGGRRAYRLTSDEELKLIDLSMIPTPQAMEERMKESEE
jgi:hypothetical protein